jgi:hypothetical protein
MVLLFLIWRMKLRTYQYSTYVDYPEYHRASSAPVPVDCVLCVIPHRRRGKNRTIGFILTRAWFGDTGRSHPSIHRRELEFGTSEFSLAYSSTVAYFSYNRLEFSYRRLETPSVCRCGVAHDKNVDGTGDGRMIVDLRCDGDERESTSTIPTSCRLPVGQSTRFSSFRNSQ